MYDSLRRFTDPGRDYNFFVKERLALFKEALRDKNYTHLDYYIKEYILRFK